MTRLALLASFALAASLSGQQPARSQQRIPVGKERRRVDTLVVHRVDTVVVIKTDTLNFYRERDDLRTFFVHDTVRDTVRNGVLAPFLVGAATGVLASSIVGRDCPVALPPLTPPVVGEAATVAPEPATLLLVATGLVGLGVIARRKR
jgi:hypothetical protein